MRLHVVSDNGLDQMTDSLHMQIFAALSHHLLLLLVVIEDYSASTWALRLTTGLH